MKGFYSIWTSPYYLNRDVKEKYHINDYDLLTFILSVCIWQRENGHAGIYVDAKAYDYLDDLQLLDIFKGGVFDLKVSDKINPKVFWAAGKIQALYNENEPSVMIDLDLIVWKCLDEFFKGADIYGIHREYIRPEIYPSLDYFKMKDQYEFPELLDEKITPLNTAMLYIENDRFRKDFCEKSLDFMESAIEKNENLKHMVFAEQRLLPMLAEKEKLKIKTMFEYGENINNQTYFTHVWGHKNILKYNYDERVRFCKRILDRLLKEFPDVFAIVSNIDEIKEYL